ncbi:trafficking protein particle complex subunit 9 [Biomphalaria glabrata]|nr:trafficking protein particle complex subunit 9 [Biomphalaria glabrata]
MASTCVDYNQTADDHQTLLVLIRHTGSQLPNQSFNHAYDKISRVDRIYVQGQKRNITIKYRKIYSSDFNSWGDFQSHRKVLGLVTIGKCSNHEEFGDLFSSYKSIKEEYASTIINSRLIVFGMNTDGSPIEKAQVDTNGNNENGGLIEGNTNCSNPDNCRTKCSCLNTTKEQDASLTPKVITPNVLETLDERVERETSDNVFTSPTDTAVTSNRSESFSSLKTEEKRPHSNSLTKESTGSEIVFYPNLETSGDLEERMKEFVTSLYFVLEGKRLDRSFERNDKMTLLCAPFEKKDYVGVDTDTKSFKKKCMGRLRKHLGDLCLQAAMPGEAILHYNTALDLLRSVNDFLWMGGCYEGLACSSVILGYPRVLPIGLKRNLSFQANSSSSISEIKSRTGSSYANGLDILPDSVSTAGVNIDDVVEKYKEAITLYSKFKNAAVIEMEACLKACRFLILQNKYLQASDFLQNVVYINPSSLEDDRIQRYITLSSLYSQIGFKRKAAFFRRVCGMHCVAPDSSPSWSQCYELLLQCLEGYLLSVNPKEIDRDHPSGWPVLQYRVLHELVYSARRMSNPQIAVRHMTLLVDIMLPHLSVSDQREAIMGLSTLTQKCPGNPQPIALDSGLILPPVPLLSLPTVRSFRLLPPSPHLQASKIDKSDVDSSPAVFIYSPFLSSTKKCNESKPDFKWVAGDICEANVQLVNPLADELKIFYMGLWTSDVDTEIFPASPVIPQDSGVMNIKLMVKPKAPGNLKVLGYTTVVCGVKSNCRLRDLVNLTPPMSEIVIEVIPPLPQLNLSCSLPKSTVFGAVSGADIVATGSAVLFAGQSTECIVTIQNISESPIEMLTVSLTTKSDVQGTVNRMLTWSQENIQSQLPLLPKHQLCFSLCINGDSDFLIPVEQPARSPMSQSSRRRSESVDQKDKTMDAVLSLQYSGGEGLKAGYKRQCSLALNLDILPSIYITQWDVHHIDSSTECRLCLDLLNISSHQIDVTFDTDKKIILEPQQMRRICMNVPRLDPEQISSSRAQIDHVPLHYRNKVLPDRYSEILANYVDIRWSMPAAKSCGKVGIEYIKWKPDQLFLLLTPNVRWEVQLNKKVFLSTSKFKFNVGEVVDVEVLLENTTGQDKGNSSLSIEASQSIDNGDLSMDDSSVSVIGCSALFIPQISANSVVRHSCSFIFFSPGWYFITIVCRQLNTCKVNEVHAEDSAQSGPRTAAASARLNSDWKCTVPVKFEIGR